MEDIAPHANWMMLYGSQFLGAMGVTFAEPAGDPSTRNGRIVIGTIRILRRGVRVLPRNGVTDREEWALFSAGVWAAITGPRDPQWRREPGTGWVAEISVRQTSGSRSASARATSQLSPDAGPLSQSPLACTV